MMANLRDLMDGKAVDANAKDDVFKHLENTQKAKNAYDIQKTKLHISLAPTRQLMNIVDNDHGIQNAPNGQDPNGGNPNDPANQQAKPGQQPNNAAKPGQPGAAGQKKPGFPNANKTSTKDKMANNKNSKTVGGKKGIEVSVKAGKACPKCGKIMAKCTCKGGVKANDYHDNPGMSVTPGRTVGLSGKAKK